MATTLVALAVAVLVAGQAGLLAGRAPDDLGVRDGRLKPPSSTANSVSSQASLHAGHPQASAAAIEPLRVAGDRDAAIAAVRRAALALPGATLVSESPGYLHVAYRTRWMGFVDDAEFWWDETAGVVQVRSASRLGRRDFGVNRERIEALREALGR